MSFRIVKSFLFIRMKSCKCIESVAAPFLAVDAYVDTCRGFYSWIIDHLRRHRTLGLCLLCFSLLDPPTLLRHKALSFGLPRVKYKTFVSAPEVRIIEQARCRG